MCSINKYNSLTSKIPLQESDKPKTSLREVVALSQLEIMSYNLKIMGDEMSDYSDEQTFLSQDVFTCSQNEMTNDNVSGQECSSLRFCDNFTQLDKENSNNAIEIVSYLNNAGDAEVLLVGVDNAVEIAHNKGYHKVNHPRKREASTSIADYAKRREQLSKYNEDKNIINHNHSKDHHSTHCSCSSAESSCETCSTNRLSGFGDNASGSSESSETALSYRMDCISCSMCHHKGDSRELHSMDVDFEPKESDSSPASSSDLSVQASTFSAAIYEDLNSLCLTDENASNSNSSLDSIVSDQKLQSPLKPSLFYNVPPTIYFALSKEKVQSLPLEVSKLLKWKLSTITPVLIRQTVTRSGFRLTKTDGVDWAGTWGKHMKCGSFKNIKDFQKVNHFPGSFHLGRKDKLWQNYSKMQARHGVDIFSFFPETYVLPQDIRLLRQIWEVDGPKKRWIVKPPASARGTGIRVVSKWSQIPKKHPVIVQRYLCSPYLINGTKFDLRLYVLVPSYEPLRIYIFDDGLVRFASVKYSSSMRSLGDRFMHLTNYSINRKSATYTANEDETICQGHKWTLKSLWGYLIDHDIDTPKIWADIVDLVIKTIICSEGPMSRLIRTHSKSRYNCYELFGFDIMLDSELKPWLLEVNISPSLHTSSLLDSNVKSQLAKDMFNAVGFQIPDKIIKNICSSPSLVNCGLTAENSQSVCMNKILHRWFLSPDEKAKHSTYLLKNGADYSTILDHLTSDDVRHLVESEDELNRCGSFIRVFPSKTSSKYLKFFEHCRYYNLLLDAWEQMYCDDRSKGIAVLRSLCRENYHLKVLYKFPSAIKTSSMPTADDSASNKDSDKKDKQ